MHDLVVLDNATVGVIVNVEQDALRVLTNQVCVWRRAGQDGAVRAWCAGASRPWAGQGSRGAA